MRNLFFYCLVIIAIQAGAVTADGVTPKRLAFSEKLGVEVFALPDSKGVWCQPTMTLNIMLKDNSPLLEPSGLGGFLPKLNAIFDKECPEATAANASVIKTLDNSVFGSPLNISKADGWAVKTSAPETAPVKDNKLIGQETSSKESNNKDISNASNASWISKIKNYFNDTSTKQIIVDQENKQSVTNSNPVVAQAETHTNQVVNKLTEQSIKNASFFPIQLEKNNDGFSKHSDDCKTQFKDGIATSCDEQHEVLLIAYGDLNADKQDDAVISVSSAPEGANHPISTIAFYLNDNGIPQYQGGIYPAPDNQPAFVESLLIKEGKVFSDILAMKDTDALCCPSLKLKEIYQLQGSRLIIDSGQNKSQKPPQVIVQPNITNITQQKNNQNTQQFNRSLPKPEKLMLGNIDISHLAIAAIIGAVFGAAISDKGRRFRKFVFRFLLGIIAISAFIFLEPVQALIVFLISAFTTAYYLKDKLSRKGLKNRPTIYGSAEWADLEHLKESGKFSDNGLFLGDFEDGVNHMELKYSGDRHLLTVAPTRSGKGVSSIIPNLLNYQGSMLVIDPKGENAKITARYRGATDGLGQTIHIVDPWGITGEKVSCFNPLDWLSPDDEDVSENAMILADSIITPHEGGNQFFDEESKALLMGLILYVALDKKEQGSRTLGRVRDIITSDNNTLKGIFECMFENPNPIVSSTAARTASKDPELRSNVLASLQSHTHFLDSPRIRKSLSKSDFKFGDLKSSKMTIYLVLPSDRLETFGRWLRLLIQQSITVNARNIEQKPDKPILFLLDEMPALGRLTMVEQAYGLMAGFGMQLWGIVQDLSQLERIYDKGWETFIGNSGVLQYFGSRDHKTADYFSKLCGVTTVEKISFGSSIARGISSAFGSSSSSGSGQSGGSSGSSNTKTDSTTNTDSVNSDLIQRHLAYPDELMVLRDQRQIIFIESLNPIDGKKISWYEDTRFKSLGKNIQGN